MSKNTINAALRRMGYSGDDQTGHGFRGAWRALCSTNRVFRRTSLNCSWRTAHLRRNLLVHNQLPADAFFLLAIPSRLFLWSWDRDINAAPNFTADAQPVLRDYLGPIANQKGGPRGESLELALASWLGDLTSNIRSSDKSDVDRMLVDSGLLDKIKGGRVRTEQQL